MGKQIGVYIRELREKRGLSQGDVARLLKLKTAQSISNIERGVSPLPKSKIKRLADILGVKKGDIVSVVLQEVQDRYARAAGVTPPQPNAVNNATSSVSGLIAAEGMFAAPELSTEEKELLNSLAAKLNEFKGNDRVNFKKQVKKFLTA